MRTKKFRKIFLLIIPLSLIFSLVLNVFLYSQLRKYYTLLYAIELDPLGLSYFQDSKDQVKPDEELQTAVFFGDSRAAQWIDPNLDGFWFINRGIGNQTTAQITNRFDEHIKPIQPDIILLELGINDLKTIPLFPERKDEIITGCKRNILNVIEKSLHMNSLVIISTIFPVGKVPLQRKLVWSEEIDKAVIEVNNYILGLDNDKVIVFDAAKILSEPDGKIKQEYSVDELHLNEAGYDALNLELVKLLEKIKRNSQ